jgi:hypothetical protein
MKKLLLLASVSLLITATYLSAEEWVSPSKEVCTKNGGEVSRGGVCYAKWDDAKRICGNSDAVLPTLDELRAVLDSCGGKFDDYNMHKDDPSFQTCAKKNGFDISRHYWSSTKGQADGYSMAVRFANGYDYMSKNNKTKSVNCVKTSK